MQIYSKICGTCGTCRACGTCFCGERGKLYLTPFGPQGEQELQATARPQGDREGTPLLLYYEPRKTIPWMCNIAIVLGQEWVHTSSPLPFAPF